MLTKQLKMKSRQTSQFLGFTKNASTLPSVVWDEESKNGLEFEIGPTYEDVPMRSQLLTDRQFSCICTSQRLKSTF